ncbi:MAG: metal-dependent hydrolase [Myxococcales bacterium]|nr:metal-dependent hydrolase [Myxococcales bacterium]
MTIPRRDVDFGLDPAAVPRDWVDGCAYATTLLGALSLLFPEGERFFVDSVKQVRDQVTDPALRAEIAGFIAQEAMHGREHRVLNDLLAAHGHAEGAAVERRLRALLDLGRRALPRRSQLAITCALEHFTAILGETLLSDRRQQADFDPSVRALWQWHALEECEHKAVAFDVYRAVGGGYWRRVTTMLYTTALFVTVLALVHARLMVTRRVLWKPWTWARSVGKLWLSPGYFTRLIPAYFAYFRPGFHPRDRDTDALLAAWRAELFGVDGPLVDRAAA